MSELEDRVARLERQVEALERELAERSAAEAALAGEGASAATAADPAPLAAAPRLRPREPRAQARPARSAAEWLKLGEDWLGRVGIGLLLLGLAFLYRFAIDHGWITPELRVGFGLLLGGALLHLGWVRTRDRPFYSQVLLGGAVAVLYLTGWAAHALYALVGWAGGFAFLVGVTLLALALTERRGHQVLAVIGVSGGLAAPFLVDAPTTSVTGLVLYAMLVLGWAGLLQLRRGWGVLLAVSFTGGLSVMGIAAGEAAGVERFAVQAGIAAWWSVACAVPFVQAWLYLREPGSRPPPPNPRVRRRADAGAPAFPHALLWCVAVVVSAASVVLTAVAWDLGRVGTGLGLVAVAALLLGGSRLLGAHGAVARPALEAGALLLVGGTALVSGREWLPLPVALEAAGLLWLARQKGMTSLETLAHIVFAALALDYLQHLGSPGGDGFDAYPFGVLAAIGVAGASAAAFLRGGGPRSVYLTGSYVAFLAWLAWRLTPLAGGHGLTSGAWAACGVLLLVLGARGERAGLRMAGLGTLAAVAGKLLLVDLAALSPGLRILLFLGFGALFLGLGYTFKGRDVRSRGSAEP